MESYKSEPRVVAYPTQQLYNLLTSPEMLEQIVASRAEQIPEDLREQLSALRFDGGVIINTPMGDLKFAVDPEHCEPGHVVHYTAQGSPIDLNLVFTLDPVDEGTTQGVAELQVDLPMLLRPVAGPLLKQAVAHMGQMLDMVPRAGDSEPTGEVTPPTPDMA